MQAIDYYRHAFGRRLARFGRDVLELLWPTRCACCERLGDLLCDSCLDALPRIDFALACPRCGAPFGRLVCTECSPAYEPIIYSFAQARCALEFTEATRRLIVAYKDGGERRLAVVLASLIAQAIPLEWRLWADAFTWIPADGEAVRRRGFDHMELIAHVLAARTGLRQVALLEKRARFDQRRLGRTERKRNMETVFAVREGGPASSANLILIDDVFTTGASLDAATRVLREAGFGEIRVATVARVW
jgi:ComF family protein